MLKLESAAAHDESSGRALSRDESAAAEALTEIAIGVPISNVSASRFSDRLPRSVTYSMSGVMYSDSGIRTSIFHPMEGRMDRSKPPAMRGTDADDRPGQPVHTRAFRFAIRIMN